ncbi:PDR/VanB family oxidoreductase [Streptacidiphilus cavernicola]|uniref:2Fe-2S iron-sulfur cluster-binding protein n=1 Tax=Streptacidiphilus cavernicola TaxID=3342716 RepID=A0ABV6VRA0_9ACTN
MSHDRPPTARREDRYLRFLDALVRFYLPLGTRRDRYGRRPPQPVSAELEVVVAARTDEADGVVSLLFQAPDGAALPPWQPGAHLELRLPSGLRRHYSLCGDPADPRSYRIAVRRLADGGGGSVEVHDALAVGARLTVGLPRNAFPFAADRSVLLIAGGIGITPLLPMAREAARRGLDWRLVHTGRSRAGMPFADELAELAAPHPGGRVELRPDDEHDGPPDGAELLRGAAPGTAVYVCGPAPMLDAVRRAFDASPATALHFERFTAAPVVGGRPFTLRLPGGGALLEVPADRSALDVLREHDPGTPYSCTQGFCGVCRRRVVSGTVEHRDRRLSDQERAEGQMLVCVSRAPEGECLELDGYLP